MNGMCPICEEYDDQIFYRKVNGYHSNILNKIRNKCGHIYVNHLNDINQNEINDYYSIDFYDNYIWMMVMVKMHIKNI